MQSLHTDIHMHAETRTHTCVTHTYMCTHMHTYIHTHYTCTHTYTHTYTHTHTHSLHTHAHTIHPNTINTVLTNIYIGDTYMTTGADPEGAYPLQFRML